ncbi:MAG: NUDIX hydrolase [Dehalococcoidia bacterium]
MENHLSTLFLKKVRDALAVVDKKPISQLNLAPAAVVLLLFDKDGEYHMILNKRSQQVEHHKGDVSFPGGVYEEGDEDLQATALRETWEEMGIRREDVTILGQLSELQTRSNFRIVPFVGAFPYPYTYKANPMEVEEVLEVSINHLRDPRNRWEKMDDWWGYPSTEYYYRYKDHIIYGATARMVHQFLTLIG